MNSCLPFAPSKTSQRNVPKAKEHTGKAMGERERYDVCEGNKTQDVGCGGMCSEVQKFHCSCGISLPQHRRGDKK